MSLILTVMTLWGLVLFAWQTINQHFATNQITTVLRLLAIDALWLLCVVIVTLVFLLVVRRRNALPRWSVRLMAPFDVLLFVLAIGLIVSGWSVGWFVPLLFGTILVIGLGLHLAEQWAYRYMGVL